MTQISRIQSDHIMCSLLFNIVLVAKVNVLIVCAVILYELNNSFHSPRKWSMECGNTGECVRAKLTQQLHGVSEQLEGGEVCAT